LKNCPNCQSKSIPLKWILFHQILKKNCNFYTCSKCNKNIRTGHLINFDLILAPIYDPIILIIILFGLYYSSFSLLNVILIIIAYFTVFTLLFLIQQYFVPLEISLEVKCQEKGLTKIQAFFSLIIMSLIIFYTIYELIIKTLILK